MASTSNLGSDIAALLGQYYEKKKLLERQFMLGPMKWADRLVIPKHAGQVANFYRWQKFGLGEVVTDGNDPASPIAANADAIIIQMGILASYVNVPHFGDLVRTAELGKEAYPKMREQQERTAWANSSIGVRVAISQGSAGITASLASSSFTGATIQYGGGAPNFAGLGSGNKATEDDLLRATATLRQNGTQPFEGGRYVCCLNPWVEFDINSSEGFKTLLSRGDYTSLKNGRFQNWGGLMLDWLDMPMRETIGGTENTFATLGSVFSIYSFGRGAIAYAEFEGEQSVHFKVQDISKVDSNMTIGWRRYFSPCVTNNTFIVVTKVYSDPGVASL